MSMESMVDSMVQQPTQPTKPAAASSQPSAPSTQSDQPSQVGLDSMVSQMAAQAPAQASQTATPQAAPYTWYERAEGAVMKHIPIDEDNKVLNWINEHVAQPHVKMGTEGGNIVEHWINGAIGQKLLSAMDETKRNGVSSIPAYAKGLESEYARSLYEEGMPVTSGVTGGLANLGGQIISDPTNLPFLAKSLLKTTGVVSAEALGPWFEKLLSQGFGIQMTAGAVGQLSALKSNWANMDAHERSKAITQLIAGTYFAQKSLREGFGKGTPAEGPEPKPAAARVAGKRPVTRTVANVEVPVSAQLAESIAGEKNAPVEATTRSMHDIREHQRNETAPAATAAMHSVLGLGAEDLIAQHDAIRDKAPMPEQVAGTNQASKYETIDAAAKALNDKAVNTTYAKADEISEREQAEHARKVQKAVQDEKDGIDHYNGLVDEHNAQLSEGDEPMEHQTFNPSRITETMEADRPKTYGELKGALDRANADLSSPDAQVREEAVDAREKAQKQLDGWFKSHSDEISPEEYTSAKKLVYAGARFQEIANGLRAGIENDNLTGNKLRSIIAAIDNRMIKRGEAPGAFRRLVGEDVYQNWRDISRLFDPIKGAPVGMETYGRMALGFITHHFFGPLGLVGKAGAHWLMDKVLSSPEWGNWFKDTTDALRNKVALGTEIPQSLLQKFKTMYENSKASSEKGMAGVDINAPRFGRKGLGGAAAPAPAPEKPVTPVNETPMEGMKVSKRENGDWEFNHPNGTSQMVLHPEPDTRPGFEGKTQLRQTGISAVDAPGAGQQMMDDAVARMKNLDNVSRIISDYPDRDRRSPDNERHWSKLARRGHEVKTEGSTDSFGQPWEDWVDPAASTDLNGGKSGQSYYISNDHEGGEGNPRRSANEAGESDIHAAMTEIEKFPLNPNNPGAGTIPKEYALMRRGNPEATFTVAENSGRIRLKGIQSLNLKTGAGSRVLRELTSIADRHNVPIELTASPYGDESVRLDRDQLRAWYSRYGFEPEPGYDPALGYMIRFPKAALDKLVTVKSDVGAGAIDALEGIRKGKGVKKAKGAVPAARRIL